MNTAVKDGILNAISHINKAHTDVRLVLWNYGQDLTDDEEVKLKRVLGGLELNYCTLAAALRGGE